MDIPRDLMHPSSIFPISSTKRSNREKEIRAMGLFWIFMDIPGKMASHRYSGGF
jgi:hypothetical protein